MRSWLFSLVTSFLRLVIALPFYNLAANSNFSLLSFLSPLPPYRRYLTLHFDLSRVVNRCDMSRLRVKIVLLVLCLVPFSSAQSVPLENISLYSGLECYTTFQNLTVLPNSCITFGVSAISA